MKDRDFGKNIIIRREAVNELKFRAYRELNKAKLAGNMPAYYRLVGIMETLRWVKGDDERLRIRRDDL